jgi:cytochrome c biogenesis protein CcmG/thiol:disulfide interchange protein DsbE
VSERRAFLLRAGATAFMMPALLGAHKSGDDGGWHHVHGPNGLALSTKTPLDLSFPLLDGQTFHLTDVRGKVVFVNLFATWCGPCRDEFATLADFAAAHSDDTVVVSVDVGENPNLVRLFAHQESIGFPMGFDTDSAIYARIKMERYPTTLILRPDGRLSCAFVGEMTRAYLEDERRFALSVEADRS